MFHEKADQKASEGSRSSMLLRRYSTRVHSAKADKIIFYHYPTCSESKEALFLLRSVDLRPAVAVYTKNQIPFTVSSLSRLLQKLPHNEFPRALMRDEEFEQLRAAPTTAKLLQNVHNREEMIEAMVAHPELIRRPIVEFVNYDRFINKSVEEKMQEKEFERIRQLATQYKFPLQIDTLSKWQAAPKDLPTEYSSVTVIGDTPEQLIDLMLVPSEGDKDLRENPEVQEWMTKNFGDLFGPDRDDEAVLGQKKLKDWEEEELVNRLLKNTKNKVKNIDADTYAQQAQSQLEFSGEDAVFADKIRREGVHQELDASLKHEKRKLLETVFKKKKKRLAQMEEAGMLHKQDGVVAKMVDFGMEVKEKTLSPKKKKAKEKIKEKDRWKANKAKKEKEEEESKGGEIVWKQEKKRLKKERMAVKKMIREDDVLPAAVQKQAAKDLEDWLNNI